MGAIAADERLSNASGPGAAATEDEIERALKLPRLLIDANLSAGAALLGFAGHCVHAETELFERLSVCRDLDEARSAYGRFVEAMIGEYGRELTELAASARENAARFAGAATTARPA